MQKDAGLKIKRLRVDGGASQNDWLMKFQAGLSDLRVERPAMVETTALGAAMLAGVGSGALRGKAWRKGFASQGRTFSPGMNSKVRAGLWQGWQQAIRRAKLA